MTETVGYAKESCLKILEGSPALIWRAGADMKCDYFNRAWLDFTGRPLERELGDGWMAGVHPDDLVSCLETYMGSFAKREAFSMLYRLRNHRGEYRWIKCAGRPLYGISDKFLGYIGSCCDVTEERESERKLEELNRSKDMYFTVLAHDLSGPLNAIEVLSRMLAQDHRHMSEEEEDTAIGELHSAVKGVVHLLHELLDWSSGQLRGIECVPETLALRRLVLDAAMSLRESAKAKGIVVSVELDEGITAWADPRMIRTILRNLLSNAVKFSRPGGRVTVDAEENGGRTSLRVRDEGVGMSEGLLSDLFVLGGVRPRKGTRGERGTGLGLAICREFAERSGGTVRAESREGEGSVFTMTLPRYRPSV